MDKGFDRTIDSPGAYARTSTVVEAYNTTQRLRSTEVAQRYNLRRTSLAAHNSSVVDKDIDRDVADCNWL